MYIDIQSIPSSSMLSGILCNSSQLNCKRRFNMGFPSLGTFLESNHVTVEIISLSSFHLYWEKSQNLLHDCTPIHISHRRNLATQWPSCWGMRLTFVALSKMFPLLLDRLLWILQVVLRMKWNNFDDLLSLSTISSLCQNITFDPNRTWNWTKFYFDYYQFMFLKWYFHILPHWKKNTIYEYWMFLYTVYVQCRLHFSKSH